MKKFLPLLMMCLLFGGGAEAKNFPPPNLTAEFEQMDFMQLYPTYSWEPLPRTEFYQVQVVKISTNKIVRELFNGEENCP